MLLAIATVAPAHADVKLAYVDIQRALNDCRNGKAAKAEFRGRLQRVQEQLEGEQSEVQRLKDELEKKGPLMQPDQRQSLEEQYYAQAPRLPGRLQEYSRIASGKG